MLDQSPAPEEAARRPRWRIWAPRVFAVVVLLAAGVLALVRLEVLGGPSPAERTADISAELTRQMVTTLEQTPAAHHHGHGAEAGAQARTICSARVYGYEPEAAASVDEVETVYGFHLCAIAEPGGAWDFAPKLVAPLVMHTNDGAPTFEMVEATETVGYRDRIKQLIPERYQKLANEGALEPGEMADLRRRFDAAVAAA